MRRFSRTLAPLLALGSLASCAASRSESSHFDDVAKEVRERTGADAPWTRSAQEDAELRARVQSLLAGDLTVERAVQVALLRNQSLQATYEEVGIAYADLVQAGLLRNPVFDFEIRFPEHPHAPIEAHVLQDFLDLFALPLRKRVAEERLEETKARVASEVVDLAERVEAAFYDVVAAGQALELDRSVAASTEAAADLARRLHEAGNNTDLELETQRAADGEAQLALADAERDWIVKRERLDALLGLWGEDTRWKVARELPDPPATEVAPEGLESFAVAARLDLSAARHAIDAQARALGLAKATALLPELELGLHAQREPEGFTTTGPSISLPLPLFDQGQGVRARELARLRQSERRYAALAVQVRTETRSARDQMLAARRRAEFLRAVVLPLRARILDASQLEYDAMQIGVFQLLAARREQIAADRSLVESLHDYWSARAELKHALGGSLPANAKETAAGSSHGETR